MNAPSATGDTVALVTAGDGDGDGVAAAGAHAMRAMAKRTIDLCMPPWSAGPMASSSDLADR
jgi:hypothetical protein